MLRRLTLVLLLSALAHAGDDYPVKVYPCPRLRTPPTIDGALADPCWRAAAVVSGFTRYNKPQLLEVQTAFRCAYDDRCLYFAVRADEPNAKQLTPTHAGRDSSGCFRGETIELFLDPRHDHVHYYQFAVNLAGSFYDSRRTEASWNSASRLKTRLGADAWTLEIAIPWADLGVKAPKPGTIVGFNVCRDRYAGGVREWSNWSQTKANFHDPARFAHLVLAPTTEAMLGKMADELRKGGRRGPIVVFAPEGYANRAYLAMARRALARVDAVLAKLAAEAEKERLEAAQEEVEARLVAARAQVEPYRARIASGRPLDGAEWARMSVRMAKLEHRVGGLLWDARLAVLLKSI